MHQEIRHSVTRNWNMDKINKLAFAFLAQNQTAHTLGNMMTFQFANQ